MCLVNTPESSFWEMWCLNKPDLIWFWWLRWHFYTISAAERWLFLFKYLSTWNISSTYVTLRHHVDVKTSLALPYMAICAKVYTPLHSSAAILNILIRSSNWKAVPMLMYRKKSALSGRNCVEMSPSSCESFPQVDLYRQWLWSRKKFS